MVKEEGRARHWILPLAAGIIVARQCPSSDLIFCIYRAVLWSLTQQLLLRLLWHNILSAEALGFFFLLFTFLNYHTLVKSQEKKKIFGSFAGNISARVQLASLKQQDNSKIILLEITQNLKTAYSTLVDFAAKTNIPIEIMYHQN